MDDEDFKIFLEDFCDLLNGLEASIIKMKEQIAKLVGNVEDKPKPKWDWNPDNIKWEAVEGSKGSYQRYPAEGQKAEATEDYKNMLRDLKARNGRLTRDGYFYWLFRDQATVGRKKLILEEGG